MGNVTNIEELSPSPLLPVVPEHILHPHDHDVGPKLYFSEEAVSFESWRSMFENTSAIHFYNALTKNFAVEDNPRHFLYALLGPRYCPHSYFSTDDF